MVHIEFQYTYYLASLPCQIIEINLGGYSGRLPQNKFITNQQTMLGSLQSDAELL